MFFKSTAKKSAKVISFLNQKGGVGKTTMAFNTAHALARRGAKVLALDLDPQANLSLLFGIECDEDTAHLHHLMINSVRELKALHTPALVQDVMTKGSVDLLPAGQELSGFELTVSGISGARQLILKRFLEKSGLLDQYDYIVIDCPPTLGLLVVNALCATHGVMVPFRPDEFSLKGLGHLNDVLQNIEEMGVSDIPQVIAYIPNLVDLRRKQEDEDLKRIREHLKNEYGDFPMTEPFMNKAMLVKSQAQRKSVFDYQSKDFQGLQNTFDQMVDIIQEWNHAQH
jgi:chromosome partitioning protein